MSLRCSPEHQQLIRDLARALRTHPRLAESLGALLARYDSQWEPAHLDLAEITRRLEAVEHWIAERNTNAMPRNAPATRGVRPVQIVPEETTPSQDMDGDTFLERARSARTTSGLSMRRLASLANMLEMDLSDILSGRKIATSEERSKIAVALRIEAPLLSN
jgi:ribosome-binding protein aMBF1 (putative translation factor)